jgi:general secretion pathway protein L
MTVRPIEVWRWWIDGLVDAILLVEDRFRRGRPVRLAPVGGGHVIVHTGGRLGRRVLRAGPSGIAPSRLTRALKGRRVEVAIRPEEAITRHIGPLPPESRPYLDGIVAHQSERLTPWLAADTLAHTRVDTVGPDDPRLMVTVTATSRAMHAATLTGLLATAPKELHLVRPATRDEAEVVLPIAAAEAGTERARIARTVRVGLAALALAAGLATWGYVSAAADIDTRTSEIEARIEAQRRRAAPVRDAAASDRDLIAALSRDTPMSVIALDNLSAALPDDTYLSGLQISRGRLRMTGVTRDIAALTSAMEAAAVFGDPVFSAPTVRLARGDRFTLDLHTTGGEASER